MAIAASYAAKAFGIKTGTVVRDARRLCPDVIPVQANHRRYTEYHERILKAVDTCLPVEKVCSIDEMTCRLMGTERQPAVARELALKVKQALHDQVGECLTFSIGIAPNVFLGKVGSDLQKPDGLVVIIKEDLPGILIGLQLQDIYGIGPRMEQRLHRAGILTVAQLWNATPFQLRRVWSGVNGLLFHQMLHGVDIQPPSSRFSKSIGHQHVLEPDLRTACGATDRIIRCFAADTRRGRASLPGSPKEADNPFPDPGSGKCRARSSWYARSSAKAMSIPRNRDGRGIPFAASRPRVGGDMTEPCELTATEASRAIAQGALTSEGPISTPPWRSLRRVSSISNPGAARCTASRLASKT